MQTYHNFKYVQDSILNFGFTSTPINQNILISRYIFETKTHATVEQAVFVIRKVNRHFGIDAVLCWEGAADCHLKSSVIYA